MVKIFKVFASPLLLRVAELIKVAQLDFEFLPVEIDASIEQGTIVEIANLPVHTMVVRIFQSCPHSENSLLCQH